MYTDEHKYARISDVSLAFTLAGWKSMEKRLPVALRAAARFKSAKKRDAEHLHVMARSAKKGRRDAEDAEDVEACVVACMVVSMITLPLVVALFCSCCRKGNFQALVCSPTRMQRYGASARGG